MYLKMNQKQKYYVYVALAWFAIGVIFSEVIRRPCGPCYRPWPPSRSHGSSSRRCFEYSGLEPPADNERFKWLLTMNGKALWNGKQLTQPDTPPGSTYEDQVPRGLLPLMSFEGQRPVWDANVYKHLDRMIRDKQSLSVPHYPHSAEDLRIAYEAFAVVPPRKVGVWSSISPWVEMGLFDWGCNQTITVDYNPPVIREIAAIRMDSANLDSVSDLEMIVSFSGIEHDGLGRYGDPLNPDGDLAAMKEIHDRLVPGGLLFLGVPTSRTDNIEYPYHRIYGRIRLPILLKDFKMIGRVWDGKIVHGGLETCDHSPGLFAVENDWSHQQVIVLEKL